MMYNNGRRSRGSVLVGGLGLGLYLQYAMVGAAGQGTSFTVIESSPVIRDIVEPTLSVCLDVPLDVKVGDVRDYLLRSATEHYDTIFLDTWNTLDAIHVPSINRMRDLALRHLAPGGQVLLWGYRWMVRLFEDACRQLLEVAPEQRHEWLMARAKSSAQALALLNPVAEHFEETPGQDLDQALAWCRQYIVQLVAPI